jgi:hypothetical protein
MCFRKANTRSYSKLELKFSVRSNLAIIARISNCEEFKLCADFLSCFLNKITSKATLTFIKYEKMWGTIKSTWEDLVFSIEVWYG